MVTEGQDGTIEFRFFRPGANCVVLTGEFNGWHKAGLPMTKAPNGWWHYRLRLAPGCYQFRYLADGQWHMDYAAFGLEHGPFGLNSVVKVDPPESEASQPSQPLGLKPRRTARTPDQPVAGPSVAAQQPGPGRRSEVLIATMA